MANVFDTDENELIKADRRHLEDIQWANPLWMGKSEWCIGKNQREVNISRRVLLKAWGYVWHHHLPLYMQFTQY